MKDAMPTIEDTIEIKAPVSEVFAALTDPHRTSEWNPNIIEVGDITEGTTRQGTSWRQIAMIAGRHVSLTCRIQRFEPPHLGELEIAGDQCGRVLTVCREATGGTHVTQSLEFVPPGGMLGQMASTMLQPMLRRELAQTLSRQRDILEREEGAKRGPRTS